MVLKVLVYASQIKIFKTAGGGARAMFLPIPTDHILSCVSGRSVSPAHRTFLRRLRIFPARHGTALPATFLPSPQCFNYFIPRFSPHPFLLHSIAPSCSSFLLINPHRFRHLHPAVNAYTHTHTEHTHSHTHLTIPSRQ